MQMLWVCVVQGGAARLCARQKLLLTGESVTGVSAGAEEGNFGCCGGLGVWGSRLAYLLTARSFGSAGAKTREEIYEAFENIYPVLQDFRKGDAVAIWLLP